MLRADVRDHIGYQRAREAGLGMEGSGDKHMGLTHSDGSADVSVSPMFNWYLVQCKPRQDGRAEEHLTRHGYMCCRPIYNREKIVRGSRRVLSESLFPGYLFMQISDDASCAPLRSTRGVSHVVKFGGKPLAVNDRLVSQFQNHDGALPIVVFRAGDKVRILDGGFAGIEAIFMAATGHERVVLLKPTQSCTGTDAATQKRRFILRSKRGVDIVGCASSRL